MVFSSITFLFLFLPFVLLLYYLAPSHIFRNVFLLLASLFFYAWGEEAFVLLMLFACVWNYLVGLLIGYSGKAGLSLALGVAGNLCLLLYFKYFNFIIDSINAAWLFENPIVVSQVHLPIGISFFTFQSLSYLIDVYRRDTVPQTNPLNLSLYIALFPQLIAGPIIRYHDIVNQLKDRFFSNQQFVEGVRRFVIGLGKKVLIANVMGQLTDQIMSQEVSNISAGVSWLGLIAYALQIYFDFAGYSDMAIGLGKMFGFNFLENFNYPYIARSIREFWRRWHISLSSWFRDYLYKPLGGNRAGYTRTYFNLLVVFFLTGLWHGASWNFVIWGLFHGFFIVIERLGLNKVIDKMGWGAHIYTMGVVLIAWAFFRIPEFSVAFTYVQNLFGLIPAQAEVLQVVDLIDRRYFLTLLAGVLFSLPVKETLNKYSVFSTFPRIRTVIRLAGYVLIFSYTLMAVAANTHNPFIYFRF